MGNLEKESRVRAKRGQIEKAVLGTIGAIGILGVALVAPNALQALKMFGYKPQRRSNEHITLCRKRLIKQGFITYENNFLRLTKKGEERLLKLEASNYQIPKPKRWDGKWRVLIFDIKENRKTIRDKVRRTLDSLGFVRLQDSVWVFPYDCEDLIVLLKADFKIGKDLLYMIVDSIENDRWIRKIFSLPIEF